MTIASVHAAKAATLNFIPREHGATAMLLTPFFAAAILLRDVYWRESIALAAIIAAFAVKDPLVVVARQHFVWNREHAETGVAKRATAMLGTLLLGCGITLALTRDWRPWVPIFLAGGVFTAAAVAVNVRNKQRSEWFQVASAAALSATCLVACLAAIGRIPGWCWLLWILCTLQAAAGIFVVHARLEARIAARKASPASNRSRSAARSAAYFTLAILIAAALLFAALEWFWIAAALVSTVACYLLELRRQRHPAELQMPLKRVGLRALLQSTIYTSIVIGGLWH